MTEATWMPVTVDPLVPPARLGALLVERRTAQGLDVIDMARRSNGMFTPTYLENAERGRVSVDERVIGHLVGLYENEAGPVIPQRSELVLDIDRRQIAIGGTVAGFDSLHADDLLDSYVSMVYELRGLTPGSDLVLRDRDLAVLAQALGTTEVELRRDIRGLIEAPDSVKQAKSVGRLRMLATSGVLVGVSVVAAVVLVGWPSDDAPTEVVRTEVLGEQQSTDAAAFVADIGRAAEATIEYDFRGELPGWRFIFAGDHPDFLGVTRSEQKSITVHVEPDATPEVVAAVLMHEVGHALDLERMSDADRATWIELRDMPSVWWPGNGLSDFSVGAGDFAEAVSALTTGSASSSVYGDFSVEQLDFVREILERQ